MRWAGHGIGGVLSAVVACLLVQGGPVRADYAFGEPASIPNVGWFGAGGLQISRDGLQLSFVYGDWGLCSSLWVAERPTTHDGWSIPVRLDLPGRSAGPVGAACISPDGLELYFSDGWPALGGANCPPDPRGYGQGDLWVSRRAQEGDPWGNPENLGSNVNTARWEDHPSLSADGLSLYFASGPGYVSYDHSEIYVTTRRGRQDPWGPRVALSPLINTLAWEVTPFISPDDLSLYFTRGAVGSMELYVSPRASKEGPWGNPVRLGAPLNSDGIMEWCPSFSAADPTFYFVRSDTVMGPFALWQSRILPIVDFNGDGIVDVKDLTYLTLFLHTQETLGDIGPTAWGDGQVDEKDLDVMMDCLETRPQDPTLLVHWAFDENNGELAIDTLGPKTATLYGDPVWRPAGGKVDGALDFDGADDYVKTPFVLNPSLGAFSVLAWVKGGEPGQVIFSQMDKADWLSTDPNTGGLMTTLKAQSGTALRSQTVVTDGHWHRVGIVWDGANRHLYVDEEVAAQDRQPGLVSATTALCIGAGSRLSKGSFWSGLIDDVRIYNRAVKP